MCGGGGRGLYRKFSCNVVDRFWGFQRNDVQRHRSSHRLMDRKRVRFPLHLINIITMTLNQVTLFKDLLYIPFNCAENLKLL